MKIVQLIAAVLILAGCTGRGETRVDHITVVTCEEAPKADPITMRGVEFHAIEAEGVVWVGITPDDYEDLAENTQAILKHLRQKNAIIRYYVACLSEGGKDNEQD